MTKQEIEYSIIRHSVSILTSLCTGSELKVIDLLTGYLWDEEESGMIKLPLIPIEAVKTEPDYEEKYCLECGEDEKFAYNRTVANGDEWVCKNCGNVFLWPEEPRE